MNDMGSLVGLIPPKSKYFNYAGKHNYNLARARLKAAKKALLGKNPIIDRPINNSNSISFPESLRAQYAPNCHGNWILYSPESSFNRYDSLKFLFETDKSKQNRRSTYGY